MGRKDANGSGKDGSGNRAGFGPAGFGRQVAARRQGVARQWWAVGGATVTVIAVSLAARYFWPAESASAQRVRAAAAEETGTAVAGDQAPATDPNVVALVNGEPITRAELAADCVRHYGKEVLESLVNRELILDHCKAKGVQITRAEIDAEIERMAKRFNVSVEQWLTLLQKERGVNAEQYKRDIIWPTIALRRLAADSLVVSDEEIKKAYDTQYGEQVKVRMIGVYRNEAKAKKAHAAAVANPEDFDRLVREYSEDDESASVKGWIPPIRRNGGDPAMETAAFALKAGDVSPLIKVKEHYFVILLCEGTVPAQQVDLDVVRPQLEEIIKDGKLKEAAATLFAQLQKNAQVENVFNDKAKSQRYPGVAALINGGKIMTADLTDECLARNGRETLDGLVNRRLLEQELKRRQLTMEQNDINDEIADAAKRMMPPRADGNADVEGWLKKVTSEPGVTLENYVRDSVWPSVALKLLVKANIQVADEDLQNAYEANYGARVRCAAIVMDDLRRAKKVWEMVRKAQDDKKENIREYFGKLSEEYSTDVSVRSLQGTIPPIGRHSTYPQVEKEAFALKPGELSGIVHADGKFLILLGEGRTEPIAMNDAEKQEALAKLKDLVWRQKLSVAMAQKFDHVQQTAKITNYLDPAKSRTPGPHSPAAQAQRPARVGEARK